MLLIDLKLLVTDITYFEMDILIHGKIIKLKYLLVDLSASTLKLFDKWLHLYFVIDRCDLTEITKRGSISRKDQLTLETKQWILSHITKYDRDCKIQK